MVTIPKFQILTSTPPTGFDYWCGYLQLSDGTWLCGARVKVSTDGKYRIMKKATTEGAWTTELEVTTALSGGTEYTQAFTAFYEDPATAGTVYACNYAGNAYKSTDYGDNWSILETGTTRYFKDIVVCNNEVLALIGKPTVLTGVLKYSSGPDTWAEIGDLDLGSTHFQSSGGFVYNNEYYILGYTVPGGTPYLRIYKMDIAGTRTQVTSMSGSTYELTANATGTEVQGSGISIVSGGTRTMTRCRLLCRISEDLSVLTIVCRRFENIGVILISRDSGVTWTESAVGIAGKVAQVNLNRAHTAGDIHFGWIFASSTVYSLLFSLEDESKGLLPFDTITVSGSNDMIGVLPSHVGSILMDMTGDDEYELADISGFVDPRTFTDQDIGTLADYGVMLVSSEIEDLFTPGDAVLMFDDDGFLSFNGRVNRIPTKKLGEPGAEVELIGWNLELKRKIANDYSDTLRDSDYIMIDIIDNKMTHLWRDATSIEATSITYKYNFNRQFSTWLDQMLHMEKAICYVEPNIKFSFKLYNSTFQNDFDQNLLYTFYDGTEGAPDLTETEDFEGETIGTQNTAIDFVDTYFESSINGDPDGEIEVVDVDAFTDMSGNGIRMRLVDYDFFTFHSGEFHYFEHLLNAYDLTSAVVTITYNYRPSDNKNGLREVHVYGDNVTEAYYLFLMDFEGQSGGNIRFYNGSVTNIKTWTQNTTYEIKLVVNTILDTVDVWIDGVEELTAKPFGNPFGSITTEFLTKLRFLNAFRDGGTWTSDPIIVYIDNFEILVKRSAWLEDTDNIMVTNYYKANVNATRQEVAGAENEDGQVFVQEIDVSAEVQRGIIELPRLSDTEMTNYTEANQYAVNRLALYQKETQFIFVTAFFKAHVQVGKTIDFEWNTGWIIPRDWYLVVSRRWFPLLKQTEIVLTDNIMTEEIFNVNVAEGLRAAEDVLQSSFTDSGADPTVADATVIPLNSINVARLQTDIVTLTNKTGSASVRGQLVKPDTANDRSVILTAADDTECIGSMYESGIADGEEVRIATGGKVPVMLKNATASTPGNWVKTSDTAGRADATTGSPPGIPDHFNEIGHALDTNAGGTNQVVEIIGHFN